MRIRPRSTGGAARAGRSAFLADKRMSILKRSVKLSRKKFGLLLTSAMLALIVGCRTASSSQARAEVLTGTWRGTNGGLNVTTELQQLGDSVTGSGNFQVAANASLGCGGESLPASGSVKMTGHLASGEFHGRMNFANVWSPPYLGVMTAPDTLTGRFMSVDRGGCPLLLVRQR